MSYPGRVRPVIVSAAALVGVAMLVAPAHSVAATTRISGWTTESTDLTLGDRFIDRIRVTPHDARRPFRVKWRAPGKGWVTQQDGRSSKSGRITLRFTPTTAGAHRVKLKLPRTGKWPKAVTSSRRVVVSDDPSPPPTPTPTPTPAPGTTTVYAVGDIGQCGGQAAATATLLPTGADVLALGDLAYPNGTAQDFADCYLPAYGRLLDTTYPVPGNHEYNDNANGYFSVFGSRVGTPAAPWYRAQWGDWSVYQLNSNCSHVGGCDTTSAQYAWLAGQLAADPHACIAASWHHPRWSASRHGSDPGTSDLYELLVSHGADMLLTGHEHDYQRFARLTSAGSESPTGLREFVVGTGGASLYPVAAATPMPQVWDDTHYGVLQLDLTDSGYSWQFLATDGASVDSGSDSCS